jgi:L-malate glycosyltransferase
MRIAVLPSWVPVNDNPIAGIFILGQALDIAENHDVEYLVLNRGFSHEVRLEKVNGLIKIISEKLFLPRVNLLFLTIWAMQFYSFFKTRNTISKFDVIHAHDYLSAFAAWYIHTKTGTPYIITLHNTQFIDDTIPEWKQYYLYNVLSSAYKVICVGAALKNRVDIKYQSGNTLLIPNYIDTKIFYPYAKSEDGIFRFISVGGFHKKKGYDLLLAAFKIVVEAVNTRNIKLKLIGNGPEFGLLKHLCSKLELERNVEFVSWVPNFQLPDILSKANVYVCSSRVETFSISTMEALACGLPVIVTESGGPEYYVNQDLGIVVENHNIEALATAMLKIYLNYDEYNSTLIAEFVRTYYDKSKILPKIESVFKRAIIKT